MQLQLIRVSLQLQLVTLRHRPPPSQTLPLLMFRQIL